MTQHQNDHLKPAQRVLAILMKVVEAGGAPVPSSRLMDECGYPPPKAGEPDPKKANASRKRGFGGDIAVLRERGLVLTEQYVDEEHGTSGVAFVRERNAKGLDLHLTRAEHRELAALRRAYRPDAPVASLPTGTSMEDATLAERLFQVLRLLEEHEGRIALDVLARYLGSNPKEVSRWLPQVCDVFNDYAGGPRIELDYPDHPADDEVGGGDLVFTGVELARPLRASDRSTLRRTGLDVLGLFPYSAPEVEERLALLDEALNDDSVDDRRRERLLTIANKLAMWQDQLRFQTQW